MTPSSPTPQGEPQGSAIMKTYRVEWHHRHPIWAHVEARNQLDAIGQARSGKFLKGTIDSDPGKDDWSDVRAVEDEPQSKMKTQTNDQVTPTPLGSGEGLTVEHILLSITIVSDKTSAGQFDDSCSFQLQRKMLEYNGVKNIEANVLYKHTKIEHHMNGCECHYCKPPKP